MDNKLDNKLNNKLDNLLLELSQINFKIDHCNNETNDLKKQIAELQKQHSTRDNESKNKEICYKLKIRNV